MSNFRVIKEGTHKYKKDTLFVLMFRDGEKFGIDVANSVAGFGRMSFDTKVDADYVFERINDLIIDTNDYLRSCELCSSLLKGRDFKDIVLFLHTNRRNIDKLEMYALINMLGFNKEERKTITGNHYVEIFEKGLPDLYGQFISQKDGKYMFHYF